MGIFGLSKEEALWWQKFKIGSEVKIKLANDPNESYTTHINGVDKDCMSIKIPVIRNNVVLEVNPKTDILVTIYSQDGVFQFKSKVISQDWHTNSIKISKPKKITRTQRRQFYRLNITLPLQYTVLPQGVDLDTAVTFNRFGVTKDISEGGAAILIDEKLLLDSLIKLQVNLENNLSIVAVAKVLEQIKLIDKDKLLTRLEFLKISEADRDKIRKFIVRRSLSQL